MSARSSKKILIIGTNMMALYNHRLELIVNLLQQGYDVVVAAPKGGEEKALMDTGCRFIHIPVDTRGTNPTNDYKLIRGIRKICKIEKPDLLLTFYTKTNIYGGIVAGQLKIPYIENICGLGSSLVKDNILGNLLKFLYRKALKNVDFVFFQNNDNIRFITSHKIYNGDYKLLPGSGVSLERFNMLPYPSEDHCEFLFCSRIIKPKGIEDYIEAAKIVKQKYPESVFHVVGPCDPMYTKIIKDADTSGVIKYHGKLMDLHPILEKTHCCVLPSYYPEGMANVLLEGAASGRPVITTARPGCGETVEDGVTGFVVNERDPQDLALTIEKFINLPYEEKIRMGLKGREKMEREFNREIVIGNYLSKIREIVG